MSVAKPQPWKPRLYLSPDLWAKPQVKVIAKATGADVWATVGRLIRLWLEAQVRASDAGVLEGKSKAWVNTLVECAGFAEAMESAGWLTIGTSVAIPAFDEFVSKRAIRRMEK